MNAGDRRRQRVRGFGYLGATLAHTGLALVYLAIGAWWLAGWSAAVVPLFIVLYTLNTSRLSFLAAMVAGIEVNAHVGALAWWGGPGSGADLLLFPVAIAPYFLVAHRSVLAATLWSLPSIAAFFLAHHLERPASAPDLTWMSDLNAGFSLSGLVLLGVVAWSGSEKAEAQLEIARARTRHLLETIVPPTIATRLLAGERPIADAREAAVLFADLAGFTAWSAGRSPDSVVHMLDQVMERLDAVAERHQVEKIKTIGDAYMAATYLDVHGTAYAQQLVSCALDMVEEVKTLDGALELRIGVHAGPVVAGVLGTRRFLYDLWGDTVNIAARMESHGVTGRVQVSGVLGAELTGLELESRGVVPIKGRGDMQVYLVRRGERPLGSD
jgi:class 3 adenylate cyclase